jgi:HK97 gp10 family phage protein
MPGAVTVKFEGGREIDAALQSLVDDFDASKTVVRNTMQRALVEAGQVTADAASQMAPDDPNTPSPDLHTSIAAGTRLTPRQKKLQKRDPSKSFAEAYVGATEEVNAYAHLVEFGDANQSPQPFLRPAWDSTKDQVLGSIRGFLEKQIAKSAERARRKALKLK